MAEVEISLEIRPNSLQWMCRRRSKRYQLLPLVLPGLSGLQLWPDLGRPALMLLVTLRRWLHLRRLRRLFSKKRFEAMVPRAQEMLEAWRMWPVAGRIGISMYKYAQSSKREHDVQVDFVQSLLPEFPKKSNSRIILCVPLITQQLAAGPA
jgi:hypothetical protein